MAVFRAFKALRPTEGKAEAVAALPYDIEKRQQPLGKRIRILFFM